MAKAPAVLRTDNSRDRRAGAYRTLFDWLRQGDYAAGQKLPSERELRDLFKLNHQTIRQVLGRLETEGYIENRPRIGRFVRDVQSGNLLRQVVLVLPTYMADNHPSAAAWLTALHNVFDASDYSVGTMFFRPGHFEFDVAETLIRRRVDGIICQDNGITAGQMMRIMDAGVRTILVGAESVELSSIGLPNFTFSVTHMYNDIVAELAQRGHRSICIVRYTADFDADTLQATIDNARNRYAGQVEITTVEMHNEYDAFDPASLRQMLNRKTLPDAIIVPDEFVAGEVFRVAYANRWYIPECFSLVAIHNNAANLYPVALSHGVGFADSVRLNEEACRSLITRINGNPLYADQVALRCDIKWTDSVRRVNG